MAAYTIYFLLSVLLLLLVVFVCVVYLWVGFAVLNGYLVNREKASSFECGFDSKGRGRLSFSLRFFIVIILFLIFDIELCFILSYPSIKILNKYYRYFIFIFFLIVILLATLEEWRRGVLF